MSISLRKKAVNGLKPGDSFVYSRQFTKEDTMAFGDLTKDYNPVHYDTRWTDTKGFEGLICHGLLVGGMICEFGGQVGWLATGMEFKFLRPVYFDDTIQCRVSITEVDENGRAEADAEFTNQDGNLVGKVFLRGRLPVEGEKEVLNQIMAGGDPSNKLSDKPYYEMF